MFKKLNISDNTKYVAFDIFDYGNYKDGFLYIIKCYYKDGSYDLKIGKAKSIEILFAKYCALKGVAYEYVNFEIVSFIPITDYNE